MYDFRNCIIDIHNKERRQNSTEPLFTPTQFIWTKLIATYYIEYYDETHLLIFVVIYVNILLKGRENNQMFKILE